MIRKDDFSGFSENPTGYILVQIFTAVRIPLSLLFAVALLVIKNQNLMYFLCTLLLIVVEASDILDGIIARKYNLASEYGAALDPYADSITRLIIYWSLAQKNLVLFLVPLCMAIRDVTVAYARIVLAKKNQTVSARISGKVKASVQATGSFAALFGPVYWKHTGSWTFYTLSWILIVVTLLSSVEYVRDALKALRKKTA